MGSQKFVKFYGFYTVMRNKMEGNTDQIQTHDLQGPSNMTSFLLFFFKLKTYMFFFFMSNLCLPSFVSLPMATKKNQQFLLLPIVN